LQRNKLLRRSHNQVIRRATARCPPIPFDNFGKHFFYQNRERRLITKEARRAAEEGAIELLDLFLIVLQASGISLERIEMRSVHKLAYDSVEYFGFILAKVQAGSFAEQL
jgi:hypothetical protein